MTREEQNIFLSAEYAEAMRYMDNAKEMMKKAEKRDDGQYKDVKYVRSACGIAYLGVLVAIDAWLTMNGVQVPSGRKHPTINYYLSQVAKIDKKFLDHVNSVYNILHLDGYYRKVKNVKAIEAGFDEAYYIIEKIKPEHPVDIPETRGDRAKRAWNRMMISLAVMFMGGRRF